MGQTLRVENNRYTSQLNITVSPEMIGETIECAHDHGTTNTIGSLTINTTEGYNKM